MIVRLATRRSALALAQTAWVAASLRNAHPGLEVEHLEVESAGDHDRASPIARLTEVGAFVTALQEAVLAGRADAAVHSLKDLPTRPTPGLVLVAIPAREDPRDVLVSGGQTLAGLPAGARVGTGSPRRSAQVRLARPDVAVVPIRGNVDTRLKRVAPGDLDGVVLAAAGLRRLGRSGAVTEYLDPHRHVPCPGQGALAIEAREDDARLAELGAAVHHPATAAATGAERDWLHEIGVGCRSAAGAFAEAVGETHTLACFLDDERGPRHFCVRGAPGELAWAALAADRP